MKALVLLGALLLAGGCSHVLSREALHEIDPVAEYAAVKSDPDAHRGTTLVLGGMIVEATIDREGSTLEVLRYELDRYGEPLRADEAGGRFLVRSERFLDPELYRPGLLVTLSGTVAGKTVRPLGQADYVYPLFRLGEIHLWTRAYAPPLYDPFYPWPPPYYWYPYDPFWYPPYRYYPYWRR